MTGTLIISWAVSICTILAILFMVQKRWWAPIFGLAQEGLWLLFILMTDGSWPLIFAVVVYCIIYVRAIPKWRRERNGYQHRL